MPKTMDRDSKDDVLIPVSVSLPQGANPDITEDTVKFQFTPGGLPPRVQPNPSNWLTGFWLAAQQQLLAGITVGPGGAITLTKGRWTIWIMVEDNPTQPVAAVDVLTIT